jgi:hypothetical protein
MKHHNSYALWAGLGFAAFVGITASGCGSDQPSSMVDGNNGGSSSGATNGGGTGNSGPDLNPVAGDGPGDGTAGSDIGAGGGCGATAITANPPVINVLLVVDKSGSMDTKPTGFAVTKWAALDEALKTTFDATQDKISYGLDLYPIEGTDPKADYTCNLPAPTAPVVVPVQAGAKAAPLILAAVENKANAPSGGTPTAAALARADYYFTKGAGKALKGEKYVLLATDGGPNCDTSLTCEIATCTANIDNKVAMPNLCDPKASGDPDGQRNCLDEAGSVAAVKTLAGHGIKTIVVGIPGTEAYVSTLDAIAAESGVTNPDAPPDYFAVDAKSGVAGLGKALEKITTGLVKSCELHLEEAPPDLDHLFVVIDGVELKKSDTEGWSIQDKTVSPPVVVINGAACTKLETEGAGYINVTYGCPVYKPPVK